MDLLMNILLDAAAEGPFISAEVPVLFHISSWPLCSKILGIILQKLSDDLTFYQEQYPAWSLLSFGWRLEWLSVTNEPIIY